MVLLGRSAVNRIGGFSVTRLTQMAEQLHLLRQRGDTVVVAETSAGGLLSSAH